MVVVGAGAAGLAAAQRLSAAGLEVTILEGRDRTGGRIWTLHPATAGAPVELGAEFVHGSAPPIAQVARQAALEIVHGDGVFLTRRRGRLRPADAMWGRLEHVLTQLSATHVPDRSFLEALDAMHGVTAADRRLALQYVQGFEAADPAQISERALAIAASAAAADTEDEGRSRRVTGGYDTIVRALTAGIRNRIRLGQTVTHIHWQPGAVEVHRRSAAGRTLPPLHARAVIVTVPLGVLLAPDDAPAHIAFHPPLPGTMRRARALAFGAALRVALVFDEPFWRTRRFVARQGEGSGDFARMAFAFAEAAAAFPTWWTAYPLDAPLLVAWQGGPRAARLAARSRDEVVGAALGSGASLFGMSARSLERRLQSAHTHDWLHDPFALGAYSYARVGGAGAAAALARPVRHTIYMAGEHTWGRGREGTVDAAIASGWHAAEQLLKRVR